MSATQTAERTPQPIRPLVISAPFGNYIQPPGATATLGTFTADRRPGRIWQVVTTVRYYRRLGAWVNRLGLRNPGIDWLRRRVEAGKTSVGDKIISIHGFNETEWKRLLDAVRTLKPLAVELNMSCPNIGEVDWPERLFTDAMATELPVIVKLPPVRFGLIADKTVAAGVTTFHCCNTLPVARGGMSGRPLQPLSLRCIGDLRAKFGDRLRIIGGGGVYDLADIDTYANAGANHVALGTKAMNPKYLFSTSALTPFIEHADKLLSHRAN